MSHTFHRHARLWTMSGCVSIIALGVAYWAGWVPFGSRPVIGAALITIGAQLAGLRTELDENEKAR